MKRFKPKKHYKKSIFIIIILLSILFFYNKQDNIFIKNSTYVSLYKQNNDFFIDKFIYKLKNNISLTNVINKKFKVKQVFKQDNYDIYIYNTHQYEEYETMSINMTPTVITASYLLKDSLEQYGYKVLIEETDFEKFKKQNGYNYDDSYYVSNLFIKNKILKNNYKLIIDLHRDAPIYTSTTINDKSYATVLFVVGKKYDNQYNYQLAQNLSDKFNKYYPKLSRGVSLQGTNYNQDLNKNMILLELGGIHNNIDEISNTVDLITPLISEVLNEN